MTLRASAWSVAFSTDATLSDLQRHVVEDRIRQFKAIVGHSLTHEQLATKAHELLADLESCVREATLQRIVNDTFKPDQERRNSK